MQHETKAEIVVVAGAAAFLAWLWWQNRAAGNGTGLDMFGLPGGTNAVTAGTPSPVNIQIPAAVPGLIANYNPGDVILPALPSWTINNNVSYPAGGSCNCGEGSAGLTLLGGGADLTSWLQSNGDVVAQAASGLGTYY